MFVFGVALQEYECLVEQNDLLIDRLGSAVNFLVPAEARDDSEVDTKKTPRGGLDLNLQL